MATLDAGGRPTRSRDVVLKTGEKASVVAVVLKDGSCPANSFLEEVKVAQFVSRIEAFCAMGGLRTPDLMNTASSDSEKPTILEIKANKGPGYRLYGVRVGSKFVATHRSVKKKPTELKREVARARRIYEEWQAST